MMYSVAAVMLIGTPIGSLHVEDSKGIPPQRRSSSPVSLTGDGEGPEAKVSSSSKEVGTLIGKVVR